VVLHSQESIYSITLTQFILGDLLIRRYSYKLKARWSLSIGRGEKKREREKLHLVTKWKDSTRQNIRFGGETISWKVYRAVKSKI
jgi:hypothetical protein